MSDHSAVLIETTELESKLHDPKIRIVEVDEDTSLYEKNHIPGAIAWNWKKDLHDAPRREFIDEAGLAALLERSFVGADDTVVLYSGNNNWFASYAYWLLKYRGFEAVKILNGGRKKWELESRELTQELPSLKYATGKPTISGTRSELRALRDEVLSAVSGSGTTFIDVRSPEEYRGDLLAPPHLPQEQAQVPGHIPAAANIPWSKAANEDGSFKSDEELKELYGGVGVSADKPTIAYCRIGERSSHTWFVLHELLGYSDVKNYDGSWTEYGSLVGVPVER
jgi:thiosulfate/3-mercaptopyruvate sulfurtransferase